MHFRSKERSSVSVVQVFLSLKPVFHMIATIAEKKNVQRSQRSYRNHSPTIAAITAIAATTIAEMELFLSQGLLSLRSLESVFYVIVAIIWKLRHKRQKYLYYTYRRSFFGPKMHGSLSELGVKEVKF